MLFRSQDAETRTGRPMASIRAVNLHAAAFRRHAFTSDPSCSMGFGAGLHGARDHTQEIDATAPHSPSCAAGLLTRTCSALSFRASAASRGISLWPLPFGNPHGETPRLATLALGDSVKGRRLIRTLTRRAHAFSGRRRHLLCGGSGDPPRTASSGALVLRRSGTVALW